MFLYDVVRNSKSNDKERKPTQLELHCTVTEVTTLISFARAESIRHIVYSVYVLGNSVKLSNVLFGSEL